MSEEDEGVKCDDDLTDGQIVFSIAVPPLPRANSSPDKLNNNNNNTLLEPCIEAKPSNNIRTSTVGNEHLQQRLKQQDLENQHHKPEPLEQQHHQQQQQTQQQHQQAKQHAEKHHHQQQKQQQDGRDHCSKEDRLVVVPRKSKPLKKQLSWSCEDVRVFELPPPPPPENAEPEHEEKEKQKLELGRGELIRKYQLHVFVFLIFLVTVLSVSLSWHYRNLATQMLHASQAIFFDPRSRLLTLTGSSASRSISGHVGLDMPPWQLPLHCPIVMGNNPHAKECVWKNNSILRIKHFTGGERTRHSQVECYKVSWESLHPQHVPHDCFDISNDQWYGPSNQSDSLYPIKGKFYFSPSNYTVGNNGIFSSVVDFYWLSARGVGLRVSADDPVQVFWNQTGDSRLCILSNYTGPFYHQINHESAPHLNYTLCTGPDTLATHTFMLSTLESNKEKQTPPPVTNLSGTYWSLKGDLGETVVNQTHVVKMAERLQESGFESSTITLDSEWQAAHGDLKFDPERFPNVTQMFEDLSSMNCQLALCVSPYFQYSSKNFEKGVTEGKFVQDAGGKVTGLAYSEFGLAAIADVTVPQSREWLTERLRIIHRDVQTGSDIVDAQFGVISKGDKGHSFRLTYGRQEWLPYKPHFRLGSDANPNMYRRHMTETFSAVASPLIVEHTSDSRHIPGLLPVEAKLTSIGDKHCLTTDVIETAFTLGLLGYPYIMVDGVQSANGRDLRPEDLSRELYIRWLELATLFPAHQHSVTPWQFKDANFTVAMAANLSRQNEALKMAALKDKDLLKEVSEGLPIVRPVWWNESTNQTAHTMEIKDQFLLGGKLLVAPVLCEDITSRDIHLPRGVWQDYHAPTRYVIGPVTIRDYSTPLGQTAVFKKVADTADIAAAHKHGGSL
ncbi:hypothetical protein ElyMa_001464600 [Elysia marginata]|uniref:Alpha-galactosidase n=1 Tax=Elysia marginata TaxID=1093978 RepID=A0AAV4J130_9GAST|nr:hypothetical protein ElyMa_001464600 [Elysia marginata]